MKILRVGAAGLAGSAVVGLFALVLLPWVGGPALFGADVGLAYRHLLEEYARREELVARDEVILRSIRGKQEVIAEVIAGRLNLREATDRFERLAQKTAEELDDEPSSSTRHVTERSQTYRQILKWVSTAMHFQPRERAVVMARLERERERLEGGAAPAH